MITTTLKAIREKSPCPLGWTKLLESLNKTKADADTLPLEHILDSNNLEDALWALQVLEEKYDKAVRQFAAGCAKRCLDNFTRLAPNDHRPRIAIRSVEEYLAGDISKEEMWEAGLAAESAAWSVARSAAQSAAWSAAWSASQSAAWSAARWAARSAAWSAARSDISKEFRRLCRLEGEYRLLVPTSKAVKKYILVDECGGVVSKEILLNIADAREVAQERVEEGTDEHSLIYRLEFIEGHTQKREIVQVDENGDPAVNV